MTLLDLDKFPIFENYNGLLRYDPFEEFPELRNLGEISERIYGCSLYIGSESDQEYPFWKENATIRAFLNEFVSLSELLKSSPDKQLNGLAIKNLNYPLFHFFKLLRNVNVHVKSISGDEIEFEARFKNKITGEIHGEWMRINRYIISNCDINLLSESKNIKYYDSENIAAVINWVNKRQIEHGISTILEETLRQYCKIISTVANNG